MACRKDTGLNNPLQKQKELDLLDVCFEWIVLMDHSDFAFFWQLVRPVLQFLQACESSFSMEPVYCFSIAELQEGSSMGI